MIVFEESKIRFEFGNNYQLIDSDSETNVKKVKKFLSGTKDVDFFGFYGLNHVFFMEVKNFRGVKLEEIDVLTDEVARKLRDTVSIIAGASRNTTNNPDFWKRLHSNIGVAQNEIIFVFWLEEDIKIDNRRDKGRMKQISDKLKQKCKWLTTRVIIQNMNNISLDNLAASWLPNE